MSASEKLRALTRYDEDSDDRVCMACLTNYSMLDRLTPVLPLIADVVEAAERHESTPDAAESLMSCIALRDAISALNEALASEVGGGQRREPLVASPKESDDSDDVASRPQQPDFWRPTGSCPETCG